MSAGRRHSYLLAAVVVLLDQLSKAWAVQTLPAGLPRPLLPGLLELLLTWNTGAAFSLFTGHTQALGLVSLVVALAVAVWIARQSILGIPRRLALGFLLGGAVGNGLDRWRLGAVVDFLSFVPISFPVFNLADVAINLAVLCFVIDLFGGHGHRRA
ncbi:signal peptidase II [Cyanobium sp. NIES-981]|uniref:signal peptidase II n=1 Tax=Cyanobium sp. NIES-981 TaxID=1851505 RepID=UPI0007DDA85C|nr:signal peptidase II [Cyanobium sp. NIES-981]SBO42352.1 Lipoprotein signal peptidase [Cyanobium sp. NIES-981]